METIRAGPRRVVGELGHKSACIGRSMSPVDGCTVEGVDPFSGPDRHENCLDSGVAGGRALNRQGLAGLAGRQTGKAGKDRPRQ